MPNEIHLFRQKIDLRLKKLKVSLETKTIEN